MVTPLTSNPSELALKETSIMGIEAKFSFNSRSVGKTILRWAKSRESKAIFCANSHMLVLAYESLSFRDVFSHADLITLDGKPLVWLVQLKNRLYKAIDHSVKSKFQIEQICGRDLMDIVLQDANNENISVGFYGNRTQVLERLSTQVQKQYPDLEIGFAYSPPFRPLTSEERIRVINSVNKTDTRILFVSLGCPKQEQWIAESQDRVKSVMIGVGGAFEVLAGIRPKPPAAVQNLGLEWLFRLILEPKRLIFRNLYYNPKFLYILASRFSTKAVGHIVSRLAAQSFTHGKSPKR
ncbi:MAG: WecB/TagA/CpsF family glycosyltransferase [Phormidesmis sp.]